MDPATNKVTFIGGPKDGKILAVPNIDTMVRLPVLEQPTYVGEGQSGSAIVRYNIAVYQRNIYMPEFFNFIRMESDLRDTTGLESLDSGLEPPE